jgi:hypothetical protein
VVGFSKTDELILVSEGDYIDLTANPEQFTGYSGPSAHRVWSSIYDDNCFGLSELGPGRQISLRQSSPFIPGLSFTPSQEGDSFGDCLEKQVYYRIISGISDFSFLGQWFISSFIKACMLLFQLIFAMTG